MLTLCVILKDRSEFTKRLCKYLSEISYPYHVYFADGSLENENEEFFKTFKNENFSYVYKRYSPDVTLKDYYKKVAHCLTSITTPYVMLADNDDFPIPQGQREAISFLEQNSDFIGCNGQVPGFKLFPTSKTPYGKRFLYFPYYCSTMDVPIDLNHKSGVERIRFYLTNFYSIFYSIFRTDSLVKTQELIETLNFSELGIHELFVSYMQLAQGKIQTIKKITYIRQIGSSQAAASQKDWFHRLFYTNWLEDGKRALLTVAEVIAEKENKDSKECFDLLWADFVDRMRSRFIPNSFYLFKNPHLFFTKENLSNIILNKIFKISPMLGEQLSLKLYLRNGKDYPPLKIIKEIINAPHTPNLIS